MAGNDEAGTAEPKPKRQRKPPGPVARVDHHPAPTDAVLVLTARGEKAGRQGKSFAFDPETGQIAKAHGGVAGRFGATEHRFGDFSSLHAIVVGVARGEHGNSICVRARVHPAADPGSLNRRKRWKPMENGLGSIPPGLADCARGWILLDLDGLPNVRRVDPRRDPEGAVAFARAVLGRAIGRAHLSVGWSSSLLVGTPEGVAPAYLRLHLWAMLDEALDEAAAAALLKRLNLVARARLHALGVEVGSIPNNLVDFRTAVFNQPLFCLSPELTGLADPFPGEARRFASLGEAERVSVADLRAELESAEALALVKKAREATPEPAAAGTAGGRTRKRSGAAALPGGVGRALDEAIVRGPQTSRPHGNKPKSMPRARRERTISGLVNRLLDIEDVLQDRGCRDEAWDRVPAGRGMRTRLACLYTDTCVQLHLLGHHGHAADAMARAAAFLRGAFDADWLARKGAAVLRAGMEACRAGAGRHHTHEGAVAVLRIAEEEMVGLKLKALVTERVRAARRRALVRAESEAAGFVAALAVGVPFQDLRYDPARGEPYAAWKRRTAAGRAAVRVAVLLGRRAAVATKELKGGPQDGRTRTRLAETQRAAEYHRWDVEHERQERASAVGKSKGGRPKVEPWLAYGLSKPAYYRRKAKGALPEPLAVAAAREARGKGPMAEYRAEQAANAVLARLSARRGQAPSRRAWTPCFERDMRWERRENRRGREVRKEREAAESAARLVAEVEAAAARPFGPGRHGPRLAA